MQHTLTETVTLTTTSCGVCSIVFAMPSGKLTKLKQNGEWFWCPNGHKIHFYEDENAKLKAQLDQAEADARWQRQQKESARREAEHQQARAAGYKGALTKAKRRIGKGVCPCCNRHFTNVERHMATQHPNYADAAPAEPTNG